MDISDKNESKDIPFYLSEELTPEIWKAAKNGTLVLFIGAGISRLLGYPSWDDFAVKAVDALSNLNYAEKEHLKKISNKKKLLSLVTMVAENEKIEIDWKSILNGWKNSTIYKNLNKLEVTKITTNYEHLLEPTNGTRVISKDVIRPGIQDKTGTVIHLHGSQDDPNEMVLSTEHYFKHYEKRNIKEFLEDLFQKNTVLFLGYGLEEPEILEHIFRNNASSQKHFILEGFFKEQKSFFKIQQDYFAKHYNITLLPFELDQVGYEYQEKIIGNWPDLLKLKPYLVTTSWDEVKTICTTEFESNEERESQRGRFLFRLKDNEFLQREFIAQNPDISWFDLIMSADYDFYNHTNAPLEGVVKGDYITFPHWYMMDFFVNNAQLLSDPRYENVAVKVKEIITTVSKINTTEKENWRIWWQFARIVLHFPPSIIDESILSSIKRWLNSKYDYSVIGSEILKLVLRLIQYDETEYLALRILFVIIKQLEDGTEESSRSQTDDYYIREFFDQLTSDEMAGKVSQNVLLKLSEDLGQQLKKAVSIYYDIEDIISWDRRMPGNVITYILKICKNLNAVSCTSLAKYLFELNSSIPTLIAFKIAKIYPIEYESIEEHVLKVDLFDRKVIIDAQRFMKERLGEFHSEFIQKIVDIIRSYPEDAPPNGSTTEVVKHQKRSWYLVIGLYDEDVMEEGKKLSQELKYDDYSLSFLEKDKITTGFVAPVSPEYDTPLSEFGTEELIEYINSFVDDRQDFLSDKKKGLANDFAALICSDIHRLDDIKYLNVTSYFQRTVFSNLRKQFNDSGVSYPVKWWETVLTYCKLWTEHNTDYSYKSNSENDPYWILNEIAQLIGDGVRKDATAFDLTLLKKASEIILTIIENIEISEYSIETDPVFKSINSPRGNALITLVLIALRDTRTQKENHSEIWQKYEVHFSHLLSNKSDYEAIGVLIRYFPNMYWLNKKWTLENLLPFFNSGDEIAKSTAIQSFAYNNAMYPEVHKAFLSGNIYLYAFKNLQKTLSSKFIQFRIYSFFSDDEKEEEIIPFFKDALEHDTLEMIDAITSYFQIQPQNRGNITSKFKENAVRVWKLITLYIDREKKALLSHFIPLFWCIDILDDEWVEFLKESLVDPALANNGYGLLLYLEEQSGTYPKAVFNLWRYTVEKCDLAYPEKSIKAILKIFIECIDITSREIEEVLDVYVNKHKNPLPLRWYHEIIDELDEKNEEDETDDQKGEDDA